jgi:hypothetical protein
MRTIRFTLLGLATIVCAGCASWQGQPLDDDTGQQPAVIVQGRTDNPQAKVGAGDSLGRAIFSEYVAMVRARRVDWDQTEVAGAGEAFQPSQ